MIERYENVNVTVEMSAKYIYGGVLTTEIVGTVPYPVRNLQK